MNFVIFHSEKIFIISGVCLVRSLFCQEFVFQEFVMAPVKKPFLVKKYSCFTLSRLFFLKLPPPSILPPLCSFFFPYPPFQFAWYSNSKQRNKKISLIFTFKLLPFTSLDLILSWSSFRSSCSLNFFRFHIILD